MRRLCRGKADLMCLLARLTRAAHVNVPMYQEIWLESVVYFQEAVLMLGIMNTLIYAGLGERLRG